MTLRFRIWLWRLAAGIVIAGVLTFYLNSYFRTAPEAAQEAPAPRPKIYPAIKLESQDRSYILNNPEGLPARQLIEREYYGGDWQACYALYNKDGQWWWLPVDDRGKVHEAKDEELKQVKFQSKDGAVIWTGAGQK